MKYFANIHNADELRKAYRANVITMHPDRGGNEEEFKAMQAEFETLKKQYQNGTAYTYESRHTETAEERARREAEEAREREEWARWEAEEKARREQEEREKAERIRKAQEESREAVKQWADRLERVADSKAGEKARYYRFEDKKAAAAFVAATKRNIKAVISHYFPGLKVRVNISGKIWAEKFIISWEDGPAADVLRKTCKELRYFIPSYYEPAGPYDDYGCYHEAEGSEPWREAYGQALGDTDDFDTERTLSDEGKQQAEKLAADILTNWNNADARGMFSATLGEWWKLAEALGRKADEYGGMNWDGMNWSSYAHNDRRDEEGRDVADFNRDSVRRFLYESAPVNVDQKAKDERKAAEFRPRYGETLRTLNKLTGVDLSGSKAKEAKTFWQRGKERGTGVRLSILEAVAAMERGEAVMFGSFYEGPEYSSAWGWGKDNGGYKVQRARAEKFAAAGYTLKGAGYLSPNSFVTIDGITAETAAAIRAELADVERQRKQWEQGQTAKASGKDTERTADTATANSKQENRKADSDRDGVDLTAAPAEGLRLIETSEGVAVVADDWKTTYFNKKYIKAHGAHWNKERKQWEATEPQDVDALRAWFFFHGKPTDQGATIDDVTTEEERDTMSDEPQAEQQGDTLESAQDITEESQAEPTQAGPRKLENVQVITNDFGTVRVGDRVTDGRHVGKFLCYATQGHNDPGTLIIIDDDLQVHEANPLKVRRADGTPTESHQDSDTANGKPNTNDEPQQPQSNEKRDSGTRIRFSPEDCPDFEEAA